MSTSWGMICAMSASYCGESGEISPTPLCWANCCTSPRVTSPPSKTATFVDSGSMLATGSAGLQPATTIKNTPTSTGTNHALLTDDPLKTTQNLAVYTPKTPRL